LNFFVVDIKGGQLCSAVVNFGSRKGWKVLTMLTITNP